MCAGGVLWERRWSDASVAALKDRAAFMQAVRDHAGWGIDEEAALAIFTELVTNAIKYGKQPIVARLECDRSRVKLSVEDRGAGFEQPVRAPSLLGPGGRGLFLVSAFADALEIGGEPRGTSIVATLRKT
jgi:anti-sigma regulatory factor (Ser/Thr protein kinase)